MDTVSVYVIFPYLKTAKPVLIRGILFRSSDDLEGLTVEQQTHLKTLFAMFYLRNHLHIKRMIYACLELGKNREENAKLIQHVYQAQTIINYLYTRQRLSFEDLTLHSEHASLYIFQTERIPAFLIWPGDDGIDKNIEDLAAHTKPQDRYIDGYRGVFNGASSFEVTEGSHLYPPVPHLTLNIPQTLSHDLFFYSAEPKNWALVDLIEGRGFEDEKLVERFFTALEWHNRSTAQDISEDAALIYLAIAFESLLNLEQSAKTTERFRETLMLLLGSPPLLDSWIEQFYNARSAVAHKGSAPHLRFYPVARNQLATATVSESAAKYRLLTTYGRHIFRLCFSIILANTRIAEENGLGALFVHNEERLKQICTLLEKSTEKPEKRLQSISGHVNDLHTYRLESEHIVELKTLVAAGKLVMQTYMDTKPPIPEEVEQAMQAVLQQGKPSMEEVQDKYEQLTTVFEKWRSTSTIAPSPFEPAQPVAIVSLFLRFMTLPGFKTRR